MGRTAGHFSQSLRSAARWRGKPHTASGLLKHGDQCFDSRSFARSGRTGKDGDGSIGNESDGGALFVGEFAVFRLQPFIQSVRIDRAQPMSDVRECVCNGFFSNRTVRERNVFVRESHLMTALQLPERTENFVR